MKSPWRARSRRLAPALFAAVLAIAGRAQTPAPGGAQAPVADAAGAQLVLDTGVHTGPIRRLAVDPSGRWLVSASDDKTAMVWDLAGGQRVHTLRLPVGADEMGRLYGAAFAPDGRSVAVAGELRRIAVFDALTGEYQRSIDARASGIRALKWIAANADHEELLAAVYVGTPAIRLFKMNGSLAFEAALPADSYSVSISAAGSVAVAAFDGRIHLFRLGKDGASEDGFIPTTLPDPVSVKHSPDGRLLAVGYFSRAAGGHVVVDVFDLESRKRLRSVEFGDLRFGNLMNVAWTADGRALYAGGTAYHEAGRFVIERIDWPSGAFAEQVAATDSIQDLAPLPDGSMAYASFDGAWGVARPGQIARHGEARAPRVVEARSIRISPDAATVQWRSQDGRDWSFGIASRRVGGVAAAATVAPRPSSASGASGISVSDWENTRTPRLQGRPLALFANESSRASALLPGDASVVLATSRALRRYDRDGRALWTIPLATEARAVDVAADGRLLVVAMADGSLRWHRSSDGAELLALLLLDDGRWVLWTDDGYFDAGPGAEDLVGWLVPRPGGERADYFGVSRFRDHFLRPDIVDRVLAEADVGRAVALADEARRVRAQQAEPEVTKTLELALQPLRVTDRLPPVVTLEQAPVLATTLPELQLDFKVYVPPGQKLQTVTLRVNGRPVEAKRLELTPGAAGGVAGHAVILLPQSDGTVQIVAQGANGDSMPARAQFSSSAPALHPAAPVLPALNALVVGVGRYADHELDLDLAGKDGRDFAAILQRQKGRIYRNVDLRLLVDAAATRAAVLQGLHWLVEATGPNDVAIVFVAGHGMVDDANVYHFLPHDLNVDRIAQTSVSESDLRSTLADVKGRTLLFVDTCYAGKSVGRFTVSEIARMANGLASAERGVIVFSASSPRQESLENPAWGNGAFTHALVLGLSGAADFRHEGVVTHKGLDYYVAHEVESLTGGRQTPVTTVPTGIPDFALSAD